MSDMTDVAGDQTTEEFPFCSPDGTEADMFIQWKGTDVCLDFRCPCGTHSHFDGYFAYFVTCPTCDQTYQMGTQVIAKRVDRSAVNWGQNVHPQMLEADEW